MKPTIGKTEAGKDLVIDTKRLLVSRMLIQASSGGGKSWATRRILEQTANHVQQVILDIEGEFATLREKFDYIICAPNGADAVANVQTAAILSRRLRETRASAIIDLYDLPMHDRKTFVKLFLEEFVEAPKSMWHPCIVVVDEAHHFVPERGKGESVATEAVNDLITRGRKRGLCGILATQRLSKLNKDSAAELHNKLIGLAVLDDDVRRAADDLGMPFKEAVPALRSLEPGEFFCYGPALNRTVTKIRVGAVVTTHPEPGSTATLTPPPPSDKIRSLLAKLTDLPKEAEQEARTLADFKRENANLKRELTLARKEQPKQTAAQIKTIEKPVVGMKAIKGIQTADASMRKTLKRLHDAQEAIREGLAGYQREIDRLITEFRKIPVAGNQATPKPFITVHARQPMQPATAKALQDLGQAAIRKVNGETNLSPMDRAILTVLAQFADEGCRANKLVLLAGYTLNGSTRNSFSKLRTAGFIVGSNTDVLRITHEGMDALGPYDPLPIDGDGLRNYWLNHSMLTPMDRSILKRLINNPDGMEAEPLCVEAGYTLNGSTRNSFSKLRTAGLIVGKNTDVIRAVSELLQ